MEREKPNKQMNEALEKLSRFLGEAILIETGEKVYSQGQRFKLGYKAFNATQIEYEGDCPDLDSLNDVEDRSWTIETPL